MSQQDPTPSDRPLDPRIRDHFDAAAEIESPPGHFSPIADSLVSLSGCEHALLDALDADNFADCRADVVLALQWLRQADRAAVLMRRDMLRIDDRRQP